MPTARPGNIDTFGLVSFIMPPGVRFGDFPVPESCCAEPSEYCGLRNNFSYQKPTIPIYTNITTFNATDNFTDIEPSFTEPEEPIVDNIFTRGCYQKFETAKVLQETSLEKYLMFFSIFHIVLYFLFLLFTLLLYCDCSLEEPQRYSQRYGRPVKISRTL